MSYSKKKRISFSFPRRNQKLKYNNNNIIPSKNTDVNKNINNHIIFDNVIYQYIIINYIGAKIK